MKKRGYRLVLGIVLSGLVLQGFVVPNSFAQVGPTPSPAPPAMDPGQDSFGLSPDLLRLFQGYNGETAISDPVGSLFNGDGMKNNGLFTTPSTQLGGASPGIAGQNTNVNPTSFIVITANWKLQEPTKLIAGIPYDITWDRQGGYDHFMAIVHDREHIGIPAPDAVRIALAQIKRFCTPGDPARSTFSFTDPQDFLTLQAYKWFPLGCNYTGFDLTDVDIKDADAGKGYRDECMIWGVTYFPKWDQGDTSIGNCPPSPIDEPTPENIAWWANFYALKAQYPQGKATQCGTTQVNAVDCGGSVGKATLSQLGPPDNTYAWDWTIDINVKNISQIEIDNITLNAGLMDKNGVLTTSTNPNPNPAIIPKSGLRTGLNWPGFNLKPQESKDFIVHISAWDPDSVMRWKYTADYNAGESVLLQWIPVNQINRKAPALPTNPTSPPGPGGGGTPPPQCSQPPPTTNVAQAIQQTFGITMEGGYDPDYLSYAWDEFCSVAKTKFLGYIKGSVITRIPDGGVSDGNGTCPGDGNTTINLAEYKFGDNGAFFKHMITHEFGHVIAKCTPEGQSAQVASGNARSIEGPVSWYGANAETYWNQGCIPPGEQGGVANTNEDFADSVAYYLNPWSTSYTEGPYSSLRYQCLPESSFSNDYPSPNPFYPTDQRPQHFAIMQQLFGG